MKLYHQLHSNRHFRQLSAHLLLNILCYLVASSLIVSAAIQIDVYVLQRTLSPGITREQAASIAGALSELLIIPATGLHFLVMGYYYLWKGIPTTRIVAIVTGLIAATLCVGSFLVLPVVVDRLMFVSPVFVLMLSVVVLPMVTTCVVQKIAQRMLWPGKT
ncbi:MAG: hypothetical protein MUD01_08760 [Chloroflexaceae bacterium]|jgi:hypothetical protein|nr:hypothetical protein [Chloroflexaceae bacterium]